jgi:RNA polymerase sigma factor (sigma-70 family)
MSASPDDFAVLLTKAREGDAQAMAELTRRYEPEVRIVARVVLGPALRPYLDSMDLMQSVHRSLMVGLRQDKFRFEGPEGLVALACTLVRRKAARHWRRVQRQQRLSVGPQQQPSGNLPNLLASLASPPADPAKAAEFNDALSRLHNQLDETERRLLELRLQGYSTAEAARELGLDADNLRVRLFRLRQRLRSSGLLTEVV